MADWRTYAKAARNTARKQAPGAKRALGDTARRTSDRAGAYARAARKAADEGTRESRESFRRGQEQRRRTAAAAAVVAGRRLEEARIGKRLMAALRDALLVGGSLFVIWFVLKSAGIMIPVQVVITVIVLLMIVRFGFALFGQFFRGRSAEEGHEDHSRDEHRRDGRRYDPGDGFEPPETPGERAAHDRVRLDDRRRPR